MDEEGKCDGIVELSGGDNSWISIGTRSPPVKRHDKRKKGRVGFEVADWISLGQVLFFHQAVIIHVHVNRIG